MTSSEATAPSGVRRRVEFARLGGVQGSRQARRRRHLPELRDRLCGLEGPAQRTVDNALMRYFIVHMHRLLDPRDRARGRADVRSRLWSPGSEYRPQRWVQVVSRHARGGIPALRRRHAPTCRDRARRSGIVHAATHSQLPVIIAMWHGQHFIRVELGPHLHQPAGRPHALAHATPRSRVRERRRRSRQVLNVIATPKSSIAAKRFGIETIRGSGDIGSEFLRKGGLGVVPADARCARRQLFGRAHRRRAEVGARRRPRDRDAGDVNSGAVRSFPDRARDQPALRSRQLGQDNHKPRHSAVAGLLCGEPVWVPADADNGALEHTGGRSNDNLNAATARGLMRSPTIGAEIPGVAERLPWTLRAYQSFASMATPLSRLVLARRLRRGKEHPQRLPSGAAKARSRARQDR